MLILGIESSCDETGIALYHSDKGLLIDRIFSQIEMHARYGGVVPELASRDHIRKAIPLIREALDQTKLKLSDLDGIAYTAGPGLAGALLVGACIARSLAYALGIPAIAVHHLEGHLLAPFLSHNPPSYPFVALLVSGGHTSLMAVRGLGQYELLGETLDDAAGEAFDKTARLMGLPYPGGKALAALAKQGRPKAYRFPRPLLKQKGLDFSFSGLKTFALNTWNQSLKTEQVKADIALAFEEAIVDTLSTKCRWAIEQTGFNQLVISGGVSANQHLREVLQHQSQEQGWAVFFPEMAFCTDNGAMIAYAGCQHLLAGEQTGLPIEIFPRWPL